MPASTHTSGGFTLIELMVVLVIISVVSVVAIVLVAPSGNDRLADEGQRFEALYDLLFEEAMLQGNSRGVAIWKNGYAFYQRRPNGAWDRFAIRPFEPRSIGQELGLRLSLDGLEATLTEIVPVKPQLWLSPGGATQPFHLIFFDRYESANDYRLKVDGIGRRSWRRRES